LAENELFGHEPGAFTGADASKSGLIQEAKGGTLFLDEIDHLLPLTQIKLLRFLQERTYRPLGSTKECQADVRLIAATNTDPDEAVKSGTLRRDFYYRINVVSIRMPPLRERREDIPLLASHFLARHAKRLGKRTPKLCSTAVQRLMSYDWPGNVRELEHVIERIITLCEKGTVRSADVLLPQTVPFEIGRDESFNEAKRKVIEEFEKTYIDRLLHTHQGNISRAARAARKNRRAFWELIRKHRIDASQYKAS
jgi:transcriptional regulator with PAS, ATPase and Fis domain